MDDYVMKSVHNQLSNHCCDQAKEFKLWVLFMCAAKGFVIIKLFLHLSEKYPDLDWGRYVGSVELMSHKNMVSLCTKALSGLHQGPGVGLFSPYLDAESFAALVNKAPENIKEDLRRLRHRFDSV